MAFLRNAWYAAAWADEVGDGLFTRRILDEPVLLYRNDAGTPVALADRCPHRFVPLHRGRKLGDRIECGYHGLQFDPDGRCVANPFDGHLPAAARVKTYPVVERHGLLWLWMGEPARAATTAVPDFGYLDEPGWAKVPGYKQVQAHYELLVDNLADLSHTHVLHRSNMGAESPRGEHAVQQDGDTVRSRFWYPAIRIPPMYARYWDRGGDEVVDRWTEITWNAPGCVRLDAGVTPAGRPREEGLAGIGTHLFTPETGTSTHYFYCQVRNYKVGDAATDAAVRQWQQTAFHGEDAPMIEAQQRSMGAQTDLLAMKPVLLAADAGAIRIRRVLAAMIAREAAAG
ncbi:aromatic ring-hydroxylating dioxygenase subunit alpha [Aquabacterium sp. J223]|uniref:aromatic ring-hydroxylating dioxygenase subunit alpha n=1 Tax=Aquabacterium sp. J223 TaxID=2898431 RepID=UPI0021AD7678|nr:aromatic ring-hydroxylating dioxygenase subunit alpha [Aquabacterium sp. J223]UUX95477.1 aromatic ring-hydroxylating dioxygenase subunit alpha [Aquabacterium sp. J223]